MRREKRTQGKGRGRGLMSTTALVPVLSGLLLFLSALQPTGLLAAGRPASGKGESAPDQKLQVWDFKYNDERTRRVFSQIDAIYTEQYPAIELEHLGFDEEEYVPALRAALLAGSGPDVMMLHQGTEFIEYQSYLGDLEPLLSRLNISFRPESLDLCRNGDGVLKTFPLSFQGMGWYYNKELFRQAGLDPDDPPQEWEAFLAACETLREAGITPVAAGNNRPLTTDFIRRSLISAFYTDEEIEAFFRRGEGFDDPRFSTIMEFLLQLRDKEYLDPEGIYQPYFNHAGTTFSSGEAAMIIGLLSDIAHWQEFSDTLGADSIGYFPNLIHPDMARPGAQLVQNTGIMMGLYRDTYRDEARRKAAEDYLAVLFSDEARRLLVGGLGMLLPVSDLELPEETYPVLADISHALNHIGYDIEQYTPSIFARDFIYRHDKLLINTREIPLDVYLQQIRSVLGLY